MVTKLLKFDQNMVVIFTEILPSGYPFFPFYEFFYYFLRVLFFLIDSHVVRWCERCLCDEKESLTVRETTRKWAVVNQRLALCSRVSTLVCPHCHHPSHPLTAHSVVWSCVVCCTLF